MELSDLRPREWTLIGGQMVLIHATEAGIYPPRLSADIDVLVNARVVTGGVSLLYQFRGRGPPSPKNRDSEETDSLLAADRGSRAPHIRSTDRTCPCPSCPPWPAGRRHAMFGAPVTDNFGVRRYKTIRHPPSSSRSDLSPAQDGSTHPP